MSEGIPFADIIVIAAIAAFIVLRYRSVLGQRTDDPAAPKPKRVYRPDETDRVITLPERSAAPKRETKDEEALALSDLSNDGYAAAVAEIKKQDPGFSLKEFLEGAKAAFEMVLGAFSGKDGKTLKMLLSPALFDAFSRELEAREKAKQTIETTLVSIRSHEITGVTFEKQIARIRVKFISEQITVVRDAGGAIVEGDPSHVEDVEDEWEFERDIRSRNPNWTIIDT